MKSFNSFNAFVAFVSASGLTNIIDEMLAFKRLGGNIKLYVGVNLNATSKEALEKLLENGIESYIIYLQTTLSIIPRYTLLKVTLQQEQ